MTRSILQKRLTEKDSRVVIDWSQENLDTGGAVQNLVSWVKGYPRSQDVHIYLSAARREALNLRLLQRTLQSLGCTVIARVVI